MGVDDKLGSLWDFVGVVYTRKPFYRPGTRLGIMTLPIPPFTHLEWRRNMNFYEAAYGLYPIANPSSNCAVGRYRCTNRNAAVLRNFRGNETDAQNVKITVFLGETKLA